MQPKAFSPVFKGVKGYYDPTYVADILCPGPGLVLASVLDQMQSIRDVQDRDSKEDVIARHDEEPEYRCHFVTKNADYIVGIEYPKVIIGSPNANAGDKIETVLLKEKDSNDIFAKRIVNERLNALDNARQESLVTKSLLDMTSYGSHPGDKNERIAKDVSIVIENDNQNPMSFDDLGKVYTNISRSRILSKVNIKLPALSPSRIESFYSVGSLSECSFSRSPGREHDYSPTQDLHSYESTFVLSHSGPETKE